MTSHANPQAPEVGRVGRILGPLHVTGVVWYRLHEWGVRVLPEWAKPAVVTLFAGTFWLLLRKIRGAVAANLEVVMGDCGWFQRQRRIYRTMHTFAWCLTERYERLSLDAPFRFEAVNEVALEGLVDDGRGLIFVTAHVGNWEIGAGLPSSLLGRRMHLVREPEGDPQAQAFIRDLLARRAGGKFVTHFAGFDPVRHGLELAVSLREALRAGDLVALQGDRPRAGGQRIQVQMFGRPTPLPTGPAALARLAEVALVPVFVLRLGRRHYRTIVADPISVPTSSDRGADLRRATASVATELEAIIREYPHQWFAFREVWPRPAPAAGRQPD